MARQQRRKRRAHSNWARLSIPPYDPRRGFKPHDLRAARLLTEGHDMDDSTAWGTYYDYARDTLGYEPNEAWKYADRELKKATPV